MKKLIKYQDRSGYSGMLPKWSGICGKGGIIDRLPRIQPFIGFGDATLLSTILTIRGEIVDRLPRLGKYPMARNDSEE